MTVYRRDGGDWACDFFGDIGDTVALPGIGCELPLGLIYERMGF